MKAMQQVDFFGPALKVERAKHHIDELEHIFNAYIVRHQEAFIAKTDRRNIDLEFSVGGEFPRHTPTVLGDAIHNLRAALDHAYCILIEHNGHTLTPFSSFPIRPKRIDVDSAINGHIKAGNGPSEAVRKALVDIIQPYEGGKGDPIYGLHKLDIIDKHEILLPLMGTVEILGVKMLFPSGTLGHGDMRLRSGNRKFNDQPMLNFGKGVLLIPEKNGRIIVDIRFQAGDPFEGKNIVKVMRRLLKLVDSTLKVLAIAGGGFQTVNT